MAVKTNHSEITQNIENMETSEKEPTEITGSQSNKPNIILWHPKEAEKYKGYLNNDRKLSSPREGNEHIDPWRQRMSNIKYKEILTKTQHSQIFKKENFENKRNESCYI